VEHHRRNVVSQLWYRPANDVGFAVKDVTAHISCRVCDGPLTEYLSLGEQPLANAFLKPSDLTAPEFRVPLTIALCQSCGLSQLTVVVNPERLYRNYPFCAGVSNGWQQHCEDLATEYTRQHHSQRFVLDIGANDGTLLDAFERHGHRVLGIDPSPVLNGHSVPILPLFWTTEHAEQIAERHGKADLIVTTNVVGHVDDVLGFLKGITTALDRYGIAIIECPHIMPLLYMNAFDTIYHEHLSYWSLGPMRKACEQVGLAVFDCKPQAIHGGTMRYYLCHARMAHLTENMVGLWKREQESDLKRMAPYQEFAARVRNLRPKLQEAFSKDGLYGWGASAKGNVLLNYVGATLPAVFDEAPTKQGMLTPGTRIPVAALPDDLSHVDNLALLSWNNARELKAKAKARKFTGHFLTAIPQPKWEAA